MEEKHVTGAGGGSQAEGATGGATAPAKTQAPGQTQWAAGSTGTVVDRDQPSQDLRGSSPSDNLHGASEPGQRLSGGNQYAQARRYYEEGTRAVSHRVAEAPLSTMLAVGAVGYVLAWAIHRGRSTSRTRTPSRRADWRDLPGQRTGKPLIESDRVEGTAVYDPSGKRIGTVKRVMIEKVGGRVVYAVLSFGGFMGFGQEEYAIPWRKLDYDTSLEGYRTDITEEQLRSAPSFSYDREEDWSDRNLEQVLHDHYRVTAYWIVP